MIITYETASLEFGSSYNINKEIKAGRLYRVARGYYSDQRHVDPYELCALRFPQAVVTADSAFYLHGLTDVVPDKAHLATSRGSTRISDANVVQHFTREELLQPGKQLMSRSGVDVPVYSKERMLVELIRHASSVPLDYYSELIRAYRKIIDELDLYAVEEYIELFGRNEYMYNVLQKEVL